MTSEKDVRKRKRNKKFGRSLSHRHALYRNLIQALLKHGRITTTLAKAKVIRPLAEKLITKAKKPGFHGQKEVEMVLYDKKIIKKLVEDLALRFKDRRGGYTRILKLGKRTVDGAEMAVIELV